VTADDFKEKAILDADPKGVYCVGFDPAGRVLAAAGAEGNVQFWSITDGKAKVSVKFTPKAGAIYSLMFSPTGKRLALGCGDNNIHVWEPAGTRSRPRFVLKGHEGYISSVAFGKDAKSLVSGSSDWTVRMWNLVGTPKQRFIPKGHLSWVYSTAFSPDSKLVASGSYDQTVRLWQPAGLDCKERKRIAGGVGQVYSVTFTPDGKLVAGGGSAGIVKFWHAITGRETKRLTEFPHALTGLALTPDGNRAVCICQKLLCVWDVKKNRRIHTLDGHKRAISGVALSPDGRRALTCAGYYKLDEKGQIVTKNGRYVYEDATVRLWDLVSGRQLHSVTQDWPQNHVTFAPDGVQGASGNWNGEIAMCKVDHALARAGTLKGQPGHVFYVAYSPDGKTLASVGPDNCVTVWDLAKGGKVFTWPMTEEVRQLTFAPDGRHLLVGLGTGTVWIIRLAEPKR
jgi:WD40 repeat protein